MNPYLPPSAGYGPPPPGLDAGSAGIGVSRQDPHVVVWARGAQLPDRCVLCNGPAHGYRVQKTFYWHEPLVYLALLAGVLIYAIIAMIVRKQATIAYGLCPDHRRRRNTGLAIAWVGFLTGFASLFVAAATDTGWVAGVGCLAMLLGPIVGLVMARTTAPTKVDDNFAWLKVGPPFLDSIPLGMGPSGWDPGYGQQAYVQPGYGPPPGWGPPPGYGPPRW